MKVDLCLAFFLLVLGLGFRVQANESAINFVHTKQSDIIDGGGPEVVTLKITGKNITSPFTWSVSISNETGVLFFSSNDDSWLDSFFGDKGYVDECNSYLDCKKKWYFDELVSKVLDCLSKQGPSTPEYFDLESIDSLAGEYLREKKLPEPELKKTLHEMKNSYSMGFVRLSIPVSPVQDTGSFMYVKSLNYFVLYWDD